MDLSNNDLEEYVEKLENIFSNQKCSKNNRKELSLLIENISNELTISRKSENSVRDNFMKVLENDDIHINQKYVQLEELCSVQGNEISLLKAKLGELQNQTKLDLETQKNEYLSKIANLENQLESDKINHEAKERELYNELQITQATSACVACEYNEKESNFKKQLADTLKNLRLSQSKILSMQCEVNQLKSQLSLLKSSPKENVLYFQENPIQQIKNKLAQKQYQYLGREGGEYTDYNPNNQIYRPHSNMSMTPSEVEESTRGNYNATENQVQLLDSSNDLIRPRGNYTTNENRTQYSENSNNLMRPSSASSSSSTIEMDKFDHNKFTNMNASVHNDLTYQPLPVQTVDSSRTVSEPNSYSKEKDPGEVCYQGGSERLHRKPEGHTNQMNETYAPVVYKGRPRYARSSLPPLKPCSDSKSSRASIQHATTEAVKPKKRKLYDPSHSDYLSN